MIDKEVLLKNIQAKIEADENIGEHAGGSGHLSSIDYQLSKISEPVTDGENFIIMYKYTISITTEFTIYPDNPPTEYTREVKISVDQSGNILKGISSEMTDTNSIPYE